MPNNVPHAGPNTRWCAKDSAALYHVAGWGGGYFKVAQNGLLMVSPQGTQGPSIPLTELVKDTLQQGFSLPLIIRFSDVLAHRVHYLQHCFDQAAQKQGFMGKKIGLLPLKTNPQRQVVEEILRFGMRHTMGVEAGSKPELHIALTVKTAPKALIVFNGRKDENAIRLALHGIRHLHKNVHLVAETLQELTLILSLCRAEGIEAPLGIRIKLNALGSGKWEDSGGDRSKFGLNAGELLQAIALLQQANALDQWHLLHVHLGSQMSHVAHMHQAMREATRYYVELRRLGAPLNVVDIGGGLGVDYTGLGQAKDFGVSYQEADFAEIVCTELARGCTQARVPHPTLATEHGRALTAHHTMLVLDVLERTPAKPPLPAPLVAASKPEQKLRALGGSMHTHNALLAWKRAKQLRKQATLLFNQGRLNLTQRAQVEAAFWDTAHQVNTLEQEGALGRAERSKIGNLLAQKWLCNFSVFQSLPDAWAIGQEFPTMPLQRLHEKPQYHAILHDITCDSDGRISRYPNGNGLQSTLPVHRPNPGESYWLGVFLVGAYQEVMGDLHNLLGDPDIIHVRIQGDGQWCYQQALFGQSSADVLAQMQFGKETLKRRIVRRSHETGNPPNPDFFDFYARELDTLTYPYSKRRKTRNRMMREAQLSKPSRRLVDKRKQGVAASGKKKGWRGDPQSLI